jgi:hypothetical protein
MTVTNVTMSNLTRIVEWVVHKLYMDNILSSPDLFDYQGTKGINCYGTVRQNHNRMLEGYDNKTLKLKQGDICATVRGNLTAMICKDKKKVHILMNRHRPPAEGNLCDK